MPPEHLKFGGGPAGTILNPIVLLLILLVGVMILFRPRKTLIVPFFAAAILIPMDQVLLLGGLHFPMLRLLALFGNVRLMREKRSGASIFSGGISKVDIAVISFAVSTAVAGILLFREWGAVMFQLAKFTPSLACISYSDF